MYIFRGLRVKAQDTNLQKYWKEGFFVVDIFVVPFASKMISIKSIFISNLSLVNLQNVLFNLKSLKEGNFAVLVSCAVAN